MDLDNDSRNAKPGSGGADALTIDATNAMRAKLGLAPLSVVTEEEKQAEEDGQAEARKKKIKEMEFAVKIQKAKKKRELNSKLKGPSLAQILEAEEKEKVKTKKNNEDKEVKEEDGGGGGGGGVWCNNIQRCSKGAENEVQRQAKGPGPGE